MKKVLILASLIAFTSACVMAAETTDVKEPPKPPVCKEKLNKMPPPNAKVDFDKKLKLTDEQKAQAKEMRQKSFEKMKPIIDQKKVKRDELKKAIDANKDYKTVETIKKELFDLDRQAQEIRKQNMKDFESILTKKQKKELDKIKKEGRKKFEEEHKNRPPRPQGDFVPQAVLP